MLLGNGLKRKEKWMIARVFSLSWFPVLSVNLLCQREWVKFAQLFPYISLFFQVPCAYAITWFVHFCLHPVAMFLRYLFRHWLLNGARCILFICVVIHSWFICRSVSSVNVLTSGESRWVNDTIFLSKISVGLGFDDETRQLSPSRNRRPDGNGTPEEEQPITIIAPASDYLSVI